MHGKIDILRKWHAQMSQKIMFKYAVKILKKLMQVISCGYEMPNNSATLFQDLLAKKERNKPAVFSVISNNVFQFNVWNVLLLLLVNYVALLVHGL